MKISEIAIGRPVFATVLSLVIVLVGAVSFLRLHVREYPNIDPPVMSVETTYTGASAEIMESQVTKILEESLAGIEGIDYVTALSREERSAITVTFKLDRDPDGAAADVRDRVTRVRNNLPDEVDEPVIQKVEADAQPIMYLSFYSDRHNAMEITDFADRYVKDALQAISGVSQVRIFGERRYAMRIWLDPERLAAFGMTPQDVEDALRRQNVEIPAGRIESAAREFTILSETDLRTPRQFNEMILRNDGGHLTRLQDVGRAELGPEDERINVRFNGRTAVVLGVIKQATANPLDVSTGIRGILPSVVASLPEGMEIKVGYDKSEFIEESISKVYMTIAEAIVLVVLIIFFFLRTIRATLIPLVTIPVSLVGAFALMALAGFSINTLTLLSLVLAIGLVVDDAIVVLENIYRHIEDGKPRIEAAMIGSREIGFAVVAMTLTLAAVYAPIGFMEGKTGRLFTEFAWTLAAAVIVSGFVALTLSPMMCSKLLSASERHGRIYTVIERFLTGVTIRYRQLLPAALSRPAPVLLIGLIVAASGGGFMALLKNELAPTEDQGVILTVFFGPEGATPEYMVEATKKIEAIIDTVPELDRIIAVTGFPVVNNGISFARLAHWDERDRTQQEIVRGVAPRLFQIPAVTAVAVNPPPLGQSARDKPISYIIQSTMSYRDMEPLVDRLVQSIEASGLMVGIDTDLKLNKPQVRVTVDRDKAADLGVSVSAVGRALETMFGGRQVTRFKQTGEQYDVIVQLFDVDRVTPADLARVYVRGSSGEMIPLSNLTNFRETVAPRELNRFNQFRSVTVTANLTPGTALGEALQFVDREAAEIFPAGTRFDYAGQSRDFREASAEIYLTFLLALAFIYLVLAAQFESFLDPLIIMLTVPLSIAGGLLTLWLAGGTLNIYSQVGLVTLIGLITKHGILIVEFANQMRGQGRSPLEAVTEAAVLRLRPILMTTGAMVLGAVPLALAAGAGAQSRQDIGWVIVGGLIVGTFFTLFVIPTVYALVGGRGRRWQLAEDAARAAGATPKPAPKPAE